MGKKLVLGMVAVALIGVFFIPKNRLNTFKQINHSSELGKDPEPVQISKEYVFVPYWQITDYARLPARQELQGTIPIYFGVSAGRNGVDKDEEGYGQMSNFKIQISNKEQNSNESIFTVRMLNAEENLAVLDSEESQEKIIQDSIAIAQENSFGGILLDLEFGGILPIDENLPKKINSFVKKFNQQSTINNQQLFIAVYGDTFYRQRPFDIKTIAENSDGIFIMAYDFHKSRGEPGPNFPLSGKDTYGYDFETMIRDFEAKVEPEKITVLFGMYGYDWVVDEKKRPIKPAEALSLNEIRKNYIESCSKTNCVQFRDKKGSAESEVNYVDEQSRLHIIWYEDERSVEKKKKLLEQKGIGSIGYWAWGYY